MFKTKEELKEFTQNQNGEHSPYWVGFNKGLDVAFKSFAERVEFYKKYSGKPLVFGDENLDLFAKFCSWWEERWSGSPLQNRGLIEVMTMEARFNNWLFDYCFGDVIE